ncbi:MAG: GNAT family N-acetyltransferase [Alphaproteobacteria bacterium]
MFQIIFSLPADAPAVEALLDRAFGPGRLSKSSYTFRRGIAPLPGLAFVARTADRLVGTIACWPVRVGEAGTPAILLGPIGVEPGLQRSGIGAALIAHTLANAAALGHRLVLLVGDPAYYARFGFRPAASLGIEVQGEPPGRLQFFELTPGAVSAAKGIVRRADSETGTAADPSGARAGTVPEAAVAAQAY